MNLILVEEDDFLDDSTVRLSGRRQKHIIDVHKAIVGDTLRVGRLNDKVGEGTVRDIRKEFIELSVSFTKSPPLKSNIKLVLAMPRPKVFKRLLMDITTMGIKELFIIKTWRVDKNYFKTPFLEERVLKETMILGLEQAKDTVLPIIHIRTLFKPFVEDELPEIIADTKAIVAHPSGSYECPRNIDKPLTLFIGPEGGLIEYEISLLKSLGFDTVTLGERILRVETAVPYIIGRLS